MYKIYKMQPRPHLGPHTFLTGLAELLIRRPDLRGLGVSDTLEGMWTQ